jgi:hypothetical protein
MGGFFKVTEMFVEDVEEAFLGERFGKDVVHAWQ